MTCVHHQGVLKSVMYCLLQLLRAQDQLTSMSLTKWQHNLRAPNGVAGDTRQALQLSPDCQALCWLGVACVHLAEFLPAFSRAAFVNVGTNRVPSLIWQI